MKTELKYIELKTGFSDDGPAWIGRVEYSKSRRTIYFNGQSFARNSDGNCYDVEINHRYWISGIKKVGKNRHWAGGGKIWIEDAVVEEYLQIKEMAKLDESQYQIIQTEKTDKQKFTLLENGSITHEKSFTSYPDLNKLSQRELKITIENLKRREAYTNAASEFKNYVVIRRVEAERILKNFLNSQDNV